jgi:multimeric flavodoxin WrbA
MMKITHIAGSPRKNGNSMRMAKRFLTHAEEKGSEIKTYSLNQMDFKGCQGCYLCKTKFEKCALEDDLTEVLDRLFDTDLLILSTPVYFFDVSGQMKCFIDRLFSLAKPDYQTNPDPVWLPKGKKLVFIQTQGAEEDSHKDVYEKYINFLKFSGFEDPIVIRACNNMEPGKIEDNPTIMGDVDKAFNRIFSK